MMMKRLSHLIFVLLITGSVANAQRVEHAPDGFDVRRSGSTTGKIDTVTYASKTVGVKRKTLVYTPPGFSKRKKYPVLYLLHGIGGDEKEWLRHGHPQA